MKMNDSGNQFKVGVLLALILVIAAFFRFYKITETPPGLYPDEATNGVNALDAISANNWKVFYPENNGREGLFINIQSLSVKMFGPVPWALRAVSGVFGLLTVLGIFLLAKVLFSDRVALAASYLAAVSFWAVNFSRIGFRAVMLPFVLVWAFYFLWRGILHKKYWHVLIAGLIYGVGFHTYISWRSSSLIVGILFVLLLFSRNLPKKFVLKSAATFTLGTIIVMSPLLIHYAQNQADFLGRAAQVSILSSATPVKSLVESIVKTMGMFNFYGDGNWRHNLAGRPQLFWPVGIGFVVGLISLLRPSKHPILDKTRLIHPVKHSMSDKSWFLIIWFIVMLFPNFLAPEGAPHALRALGAMPAAFIIAALGFDLVYNTLQQKLNRVSAQPANEPWRQQILRIKKELILLYLAVLALIGLWEYRAYFVVWANKLEVMNSFDQRLTDIGNYLKQLDRSTEKYVIVNESGIMVKGVPIQAQPIMYLANKENIKYLTQDRIGEIPLDLEDAVIVPTYAEPNILSILQQKYPQAHLGDLATFRTIRITKQNER